MSWHVRAMRFDAQIVYLDRQGFPNPDGSRFYGMWDWFQLYAVTFESKEQAVTVLTRLRMTIPYLFSTVSDIQFVQRLEPRSEARVTAYPLGDPTK